MSDILLHDVDPALERALEARARANARSVSDEIKATLAQTLPVQSNNMGVGSKLAALIPPELWVDEVFHSVDVVVDDSPDFS